MRRYALPFFLSGLLPLTLAGCHQGYSPNTYASTAAQQEASVQRGVVIGVRQVMISASGAVGAAAGGAIGGVAGSQLGGGPVASALGAIGGTLIGGIGGTKAGQAVADTKGWEYIIQETGNKLVSVTQTSKTALPPGTHVLVIADSQQARIVPDYTTQLAPAPGTASAPEIRVSPVLPPPGDITPLQVAPIAVADNPPASPAAASKVAAPATVNIGNTATGLPAPASTAQTTPAQTATAP